VVLDTLDGSVLDGSELEPVPELATAVIDTGTKNGERLIWGSPFGDLEITFSARKGDLFSTGKGATFSTGKIEG